MHIHNPACIAVGVAFRVVVVALVVAQPAADARSRRTRRIACEHDASQLYLSSALAPAPALPLALALALALADGPGCWSGC